MINNFTRCLFLSLIAIFPYSFVVAQDCAVDKAELKGTYSGDCKKGKANGKGKAVGTDTYEGDFLAGLPDGRGTYRWPNGSEFTGEFSKGLKQGKGKLIYKMPSGDSLIDGYWKKDVYIGKNENPWKVIYKSKLVNDVEIEHKKDGFNKITFFITNTSGGAAYIDGTEMPKLKVDEIRATVGAYGRLYVNDNHSKKTESIVEEVRYPFRMKAIIGTEELEIEFFEAGTYILNIRIND